MSEDELVALYDRSGRPCGCAPRSRVRAENLRHGASVVAVLDAAGRIYVHRRTETKDVFPGRFDFCAGGVLLAGEEPYAGAVREAEEELGVHEVELEPLGEAEYADEHTTYHAFLYCTTYTGPIRWQPEEVAWGEWVEPAEVVRRMEAEPESFVPDSVLLGGWLRGR